jgi:hypothetical protein
VSCYGIETRPLLTAISTGLGKAQTRASQGLMPHFSGIRVDVCLTKPCERKNDSHDAQNAQIERSIFK